MNSPIFILSTGRTGTQFFEDYINQTTNKVICRHEPKPSWRFKFLSNMYLNNKISGKRVTKIYKFSRKSLFKKIGDKIYIESSNFIFGCITALNEYYDSIKIIHIVRHPFTYIESHLNHGFWKGHKKFFARFVPYWLENVNPEDSLNPVHILSNRWNYVNNQIASCKNTNEYTCVRFEDLFSEDRSLGSDMLIKVREFCSIPINDSNINIRWLRRPKNYSRKRNIITELDKDFIYENNKVGMVHYNYFE